MKNTGKNVFIDEMGDYYKTGEYLKLNCNIAEKLEVKKTLLTKALTDAGITNLKVREVVVFTNNRIEVHNKYSSLCTCFVSHLNHIIDDFKGEVIFEEEDMEQIRSVIQNTATKEYYPADFDVEQYKLDFATVMATLEEASAVKKETCEEAQRTVKITEPENATFADVLRTIFMSKYTRYAGSVAACFTLAILPGVVANNIIKR